MTDQREPFHFLWYPDAKENGREYSEEEIINHASMYKQDEMCGIYFLLSCDEIVYVGQTVDLKSRLKSHWKSDKGWNRYFFIKCEQKELNRLEAYYILRFRPRYNIAIPKGEK